MPSNSPPTNTPDDKRDAIQSLLAIYNNSMDLEAQLRLAASPQVAALDAKNNALSDGIDNVVGHAMDNWLTDAKQVTTQMQAANQSLQNQITQIEQDVTDVAAIVQAIGYVDQALQAAVKLVALA
jgi:hypothetical protein